MRIVLALLSMLLSGVSSALADVVITLDSKSPSATWTDTLFVTPAGFRWETGTTVMIYRSDTDILFDVSPARQRYTRITSEKLRELAAAFDAARRNWRERLAAMPEDQRQRMQDRLRREEDVFSPPSVTSTAALTFRPAEDGTPADPRCRMLLMAAVAEVKRGSVCVAPLAELGLAPEDMPAWRALTAFVLQGPKPDAGPFSVWNLDAIEQAAGYPAFPVETRIIVPNGEFAYRLRSVERRGLQSSLFDLPPGLVEEAMPPRPGQ